MVDKQELHHALARLLDHLRVGDDLLTLGGRQGAGGLRLGRAWFHFHQAHPAVAGDRQTLVVAEARNLAAGELGDLKHGHAGLELDLDAVHLGFGHEPLFARYSAAIKVAPWTWGLRAR